MNIIHTGYCMSHRGRACNCGAADTIHDESGIAIGEARPLVEPTDIDIERLPGCLDDTPCELPDILDDEVLPTSGIEVIEHETVLERIAFVQEYLSTREYDRGRLYLCG